MPATSTRRSSRTAVADRCDFSLHVRALFIALLIGVLTWGAGNCGRVLSQGAATSIAPEEAIISLAPYKLTSADLPSGYTVSSASAVIPSVLAFANASQKNEDPHALLRQDIFATTIGIVGLNQSVGLTPPRVLQNGSLNVLMFLFPDPNAAARYVSIRYGNVDVSPGGLLGDGTIQARQVTFTPAGGAPPRDSFDIRWKRGQVAFEVQSNAPTGQITLTDVQVVAAAVDKKAATVPPPSLGPPTVVPPATEDQRIDAMAKLFAIELTAADAPGGLTQTVHQIDHPARAVISSQDPRTTLQRIDVRWKQIITASEFFLPPSSLTPPISFSLSLDADAQGAANQLEDSFTPTSPPSPNSTRDPMEPPLALGDASFGYVTHGTRADNTTFEGMSLGWTHGPLVLSASTSTPPGLFSPDEFIAFVRMVEAAYRASALAATIPAPTPTLTYAAGWNLISGPPGTDFSAAQDPTFTIQPGDSGYETISPLKGVKSGFGYWAFFAQATGVRLPAGSDGAYSIAVPSGQYVMIGNPSGTRSATVTGADDVLTYDPGAGYQHTTGLPPGRGAWAYSENGGTILVTPTVVRP